MVKAIRQKRFWDFGLLKKQTPPLVISQPPVGQLYRVINANLYLKLIKRSSLRIIGN